MSHRPSYSKRPPTAASPLSVKKSRYGYTVEPLPSDPQRSLLELRRLLAAADRHSGHHASSDRVHRMQALLLECQGLPAAEGLAEIVARHVQRVRERQPTADQQEHGKYLDRIFPPKKEANDNPVDVDEQEETWTSSPSTPRRRSSATAASTTAAPTTAAGAPPVTADAATRAARVSAPPPTPSVADLQATQRRQMESAIAKMASDIKASTADIHVRLQSQSTHLDDLTAAAEENVDSVAQVAADVQQNVRRGWSRTLGTWTLLFTLAGVFVFTLLTIQMVPKRPGACLFFCPKASTQFCRTVGGRLECLDQVPVADTLPPVRREVPESTDCELDLYGACLPPLSDAAPAGLDEAAKHAEQVRQQALREYLDGRQLEQHQDDGSVDGDKLPAMIDDDDDFEDPFEDLDVEAMRAEALREYMQANPNVQLEDVDIEVEEDPVVQAEPIIDEIQEPQQRQEDQVPESIEQTPEAPPLVAVYNDRPFVPKDLRRAAASGACDNVRGYLAVRPDWVDRGDVNHWNALHLAARAGHTACVEALIFAGANVLLPTATHKTAEQIALAAHGRAHDIVRLLYLAATNRYAVDPSAVDIWYDVEEVKQPVPPKLVVDDSEDEDDDDDEYDSDDDEEDAPLSLADLHDHCHHGDLDRVRAYRGSDLLCQADANRWTSLHIAARAGQGTTVRYLYERGCDRHARTLGGQTPLDVAQQVLGDDHELTIWLRQLE